MTTFTAALPFLKGALARSLSGGGASLYTFHCGWMYARSPAIVAAYPMPHMRGVPDEGARGGELAFAMGADELEGAVDRMGAEPTVGAGDGTIVLRVGRMRSSIDLLDAEPPDRVVQPDPGWPSVPADLISALRAARMFIDEKGSWNRGVKLETGRLLAVSGRSAVSVDVPGLTVEDGQAALSDDAVDYLTKLREPPASWLLEPGSASFAWESGAWVRCQLVAIPWPDGVFERVMAGVGDDVPHHGEVEVGEDFRSSFNYVSSLGHEVISIGPSGIVGKSAHGEHHGEIELGLSDTTSWSIRSLKPVVEVAERFRPHATGRGRFEAKNLRGVVAARTE